MTIQEKIRLILFWDTCVILAVVALLVMFCAIFTGSSRAWRIAISFDQTGNAAMGGDEDETISSRCWRNRAEPHYSALVQIIDFLFGDRNHCKNSFEDEQRKRMM